MLEVPGPTPQQHVELPEHVAEGLVRALLCNRLDLPARRRHRLARREGVDERLRCSWLAVPLDAEPEELEAFIDVDDGGLLLRQTQPHRGKHVRGLLAYRLCVLTRSRHQHDEGHQSTAGDQVAEEPQPADDVDPNLWITFPNEDQYTLSWPPGRTDGVMVRTDDSHLLLSDPFDPAQLVGDVDTLDTLYALTVHLDDFCPGAEFSAVLGSLVDDRLVKPYVEFGEGSSVRKLGLVDARDETSPLVAVYQRKGSVRFNLRPQDVPEMLEPGAVWATSTDPKRARVACRASDESRVYGLF